MTTTSPAPFPTHGQRPLSAREQMQRMNALACTLPQDNQPRCSGQLFAGFFFDGTGNNMQRDYEEPPPDKRKHSNIVRLLLTHKDQNTQGYFAYYMPGVGTPFPEIGDTSTYWTVNRGSAGGEKGEHRIIWALTRLINTPHYYVTNALLIDDPLAKTITDNISAASSPNSYRRMVLNTWQEKLKAALQGRRPLVEQINLSVFGFSRGAAEARVFVNWLFEVCKQEKGGWTFAGIPIRVQFMGIFDTVASVGMAGVFGRGLIVGHQSWADNTLEIHPAVEQCMHYVAGHEVRACFPLDSVRVKSSYPANAKEVMYPGAHSDIGGGYAPGDLGVSHSQDSFVSIIPGVDMYHAARKAGVPLEPWENLKEAIQKSLTPSQQVIKDFNAYLRDAKPTSGPVEEMHRHHMSLYHTHRFKYRQTFFSRKPYVLANQKHQGFLKKTQNCLIERLGHLGQGNPMAEDFNPAQAAKLRANMWRAAGLNNMADSVTEKSLTEVASRIDEKRLTPNIEAFFDHYLHDSMAGFNTDRVDEYWWNGMGFVKFRTVLKGND